MNDPADEQYQELIASDRVSEATRDVLHKRAAAGDGATVFSPSQREALRAIADCLLPQKHHPIDLPAGIEARLASKKGNGWRYDILPADTEAYALALDELDRYAVSVYRSTFAEIGRHQQEDILLSLQNGLFEPTKSSVAAPGLDGNQMACWFKECRADLIGTYMAHPQVLSQIGYSGIADGSNSNALTGFVNVGLNQKEPWEPELRGPK